MSDTFTWIEYDFKGLCLTFIFLSLFQSSCKRFMSMYRRLSLGEKCAFLRHLAENYGVNQENILQVSESIIASRVSKTFLFHFLIGFII